MNKEEQRLILEAQYNKYKKGLITSIQAFSKSFETIKESGDTKDLELITNVYSNFADLLISKVPLIFELAYEVLNTKEIELNTQNKAIDVITLYDNLYITFVERFKLNT